MAPKLISQWKSRLSNKRQLPLVIFRRCGGSSQRLFCAPHFMTRSGYSPWLNRFAILTAAATLALIGIGGLVTSHEAGLAVPDWPTTYGYNMFLFPPSQWMGGIFYEHTHRLFASFVGLLTTVLAVWLWMKDSRRWMRWLGLGAFFAVVLQGVLGGLRVTLLQDSLGVVHATIAHLFLLLVSVIALATSSAWRRSDESHPGTKLPFSLRYLLVGATAMIVVQLILGAAMRHQHAGLAVPDFPLAYGKVWPSTDAASLETINRNRTDGFDPKPITAFQIGLHMTHRIGALVTLLLTGLCAWNCRAQLGRQSGLAKLTCAWLALIVLQAILGASTVWSRKAADVATAHVVTGAASLVLGGLLSVAANRLAQKSGISKIGARRSGFGAEPGARPKAFQVAG